MNIRSPRASLLAFGSGTAWPVLGLCLAILTGCEAPVATLEVGIPSEPNPEPPGRAKASAAGDGLAEDEGSMAGAGEKVLRHSQFKGEMSKAIRTVLGSDGLPTVLLGANLHLADIIEIPPETQLDKAVANSALNFSFPVAGEVLSKKMECAIGTGGWSGCVSGETLLVDLPGWSELAPGPTKLNLRQSASLGPDVPPPLEIPVTKLNSPPLAFLADLQGNPRVGQTLTCKGETSGTIAGTASSSVTAAATPSTFTLTGSLETDAPFAVRTHAASFLGLIQTGRQVTNTGPVGG